MKSNNKWWGLFGKGKEIRELKEKVALQKEEIKQLREEGEKEVQKYINQNWNMLEQLSKAHDERDLALKKIEELKAQIKIVNGQKGNLTRKVNELTKRVEELKKQLAESMTDKFRVKKMPSGKKPKGQSIRIKSSSKQSKIIKKVKAI